MRSSIVSAAIGLSLLAGVEPALATPEPPPPSQAEHEARERSRAHFRAGVVQLRAQEWKAARESFEQAWTLYPHPSILLNLGVARLRTNEPVLAEQALVRFLSEDFGATPEELAGARAALAEARTRIGTLRVAVSPPVATVLVDGRLIAERVGAVAEVRVAAGKHTVTASSEGYADAVRKVDVAPRSEVDTKIELVPRATAATESAAGGSPGNGGSSGNGDAVVQPSAHTVSGRSITGYALGGVAGVALVTAGVCGFRALSLASDYEDRGQAAAFQNPDVKSEGETFRTLADVAIGVAVVTGIASAILLFTDIGRGKGADVRRSPAVLRW